MFRTLPNPFRKNAFDPLRLPLPRSWNFQRLLPDFETAASTRTEDRGRSERLKRSSTVSAVALGQYLDDACTQMAIPLTFASARYVHEVRVRLIGGILEALEMQSVNLTELITFTIVNPQWAFQNIGKCHPSQILQIMRSRLIRSGSQGASGVIFSAVDVESDGYQYQVHLHGFASGEKSDLLQACLARWDIPSTTDIRVPIACAPIQNIAKQASYCLKPYCNMRPWYLNKKGVRRRSKGRRLPMHLEEEMLMWFASKNLSDLCLLHGMKVGTQGITIT